MQPNDRRLRMLSKFRQVTADRLSRVHAELDQICGGNSNADLIIALKRDLHTIKGEAKLMKFSLASRVAHQLEDFLNPAFEQGRVAQVRDLATEGLDLIAELVEQNEPYSQGLTQRVQAFFESGLTSAPGEQTSSKAGNTEAGTTTTRDARHARMVAKLRQITPERITTIRELINRKDWSADNREALRREMHTIKGETRLMKFALASEVAQKLEEQAKAFIANSELDRELLETGLSLVAELVANSEPYDAVLSDRAARFIGSDHGSPPPSIVATPLARTGAATEGPPAPTSADPVATPLGTRHERRSQPPPAPIVEPSAIDDFVRVQSSHLVALTNVAGNLVVRHEQLERSISDVERIARSVLDEVEKLGRHLRQDGGARIEGITRRRDSLPRLAAFGRELLSTTARAREEQFQNRLLLSTLQAEIREIRMVRMGDLFERQARSIRQIAKEQGKMVHVRVEGSSVTVDKQILEHLEEPLIHLTRNAIDHGVEAPSERVRAGKNQRAQISLIAREVGGHVEVIVADDGKGIDESVVLDSALRKGFISSAERDSMSRDQILSLLFRPGFTTRTEASDLSGRGVGLDVVNSQLAELGGTVTLTSSKGHGAQFSLRSPISMAFARGLVVKAADELYAIPSAAIVEVLHLPESKIHKSGDGRSIKFDNRRIPLVSLAGLLGQYEKRDGDVLKVVLLQGYGSIALQVDDVLGEKEAVRRNLNSFISGVSLISGTATVEGRRLVMFLHLPELFRLAGAATAIARSGKQVHVSAPNKPRLLVVDDSELTRDMLVSLLERLNFIVDEAVDGADALAVLQKNVPDLVMTDLDMPVMDGFALLEKIRESPRFEDLPVIVFSTRSSEDAKRRAMQAGATAYLVKAAFRAEELHRTLRHYLRRPKQRA